MTTQSQFVLEQAAAFRTGIDVMMRETREKVAMRCRLSSLSMRLTRNEVKAAAHDACFKAVPTDAASLTAILLREPHWFECDVSSVNNEVSPETMLDALRRSMAAEIASEVLDDVRAAVLSQYEGATFASVLGELRVLMAQVDHAGKGTQDALAAACDEQEGKPVPYGRMLLTPIERLRNVLLNTARSGDMSMLVPARTLLELSDFIDGMGTRLDKTHVPPVTSPKGRRI